ncbi:unnamed protein product [Merluccius merluccius]
MAARRGDRQLLRSLLRLRRLAALEEEDSLGHTALHVAAKAGNIGCVHEILSMMGEYGETGLLLVLGGRCLAV